MELKSLIALIRNEKPAKLIKVKFDGKQLKSFRSYSELEMFTERLHIMVNKFNYDKDEKMLTIII